MKHLVIIPARAGSVRVPNKNIMTFCGKPLLAWTIEYALRSAKIDRVILSTDSMEIAQIGKSYGADVPFIRPGELAAGDTVTEKVIIHALDVLAEDGYVPDVVITMQVTSPYRQPNRIEEAINLYEATQADSVFTAVCQAPFLWRGKNKPEALYDYQNRPFTHELSQDKCFFRENGSFYLSDVSMLRTTGNRLGRNPQMLLLSELESFDIDTLEDFIFAEKILSAQLVNTD